MTLQSLYICHLKWDRQGLRWACLCHCLWLLTITCVECAPANSSSADSATETYMYFPSSNQMVDLLPSSSSLTIIPSNYLSSSNGNLAYVESSTETYMDSDLPFSSDIPLVDLLPSTSISSIIPSIANIPTSKAIQTNNDMYSSNVDSADFDSLPGTLTVSGLPAFSSIPIVDVVTPSSSHTIIPSNDPSPSNVNLGNLESTSFQDGTAQDSISVLTIIPSKPEPEGSSETFVDMTSHCYSCLDGIDAGGPTSLTGEEPSSSVTPRENGVKDPKGPPYSKCTDVVNSWYAAQRAKRDQKDTAQTTSEMSDRSSVVIERTVQNEFLSPTTVSELDTLAKTDPYDLTSSVNEGLSNSDTSGTYEYYQTDSTSTSLNWTMQLPSVDGLNTSLSETLLTSSLTLISFESSDDISSISSPSLSDVIKDSFITAASTSLNVHKVVDMASNSQLDLRSKQPMYTVYYNFSGVIVFCETTELPKYLTPKTANVLDPPSLSLNVTPSAELSNTIDLSDDMNNIATESPIINPTTTGSDSSNIGINFGIGNTTPISGSVGGSGNGGSGEGGSGVNGTESGSGGGGGDADGSGGSGGGGDGSGGSGGVGDGDDGAGGVGGVNGVDGATTSSGNIDEGTSTAFSETIEPTTPYSRKKQAVSQPVLIGLICGLVFCVAMIVLCTCLWKFCCKGPNMTPHLYKYKAKILRVSPVPPTPPPPSRQKLVFIAD